MEIIVNDTHQTIELYGEIVMFDFTAFVNNLENKDTYRIIPTLTPEKPLPVTKPYEFRINGNEFSIYGRVRVMDYKAEANTIEIDQRQYYIVPTHKT